MARKKSIRKKNMPVGTSAKNSCMVLTLDTHGPDVEVNDYVEVDSTKVNFKFFTDDSTWQDYKAWGDFDVSSAGINHDLVGETYDQAPWVDSRFTVDQTVSPTGSIVDGYKFHFSFRDDVWNERRLIVVFDSNRIVSANNACAALTLDTIGPDVEVDDLVEFNSTKVNFEFFTDDSTWESYKAWGDFDVSGTGINHDLVGETYASAPWVDSRFTVDQTLSPTGNVVDGYKFHFSFRDDVWNEREVTVVYDSSRTMLIECADNADILSKLLIQSLGDDLGIEYASSELFLPEEERVDPPSVRYLFEMLLSAQIKGSADIATFIFADDIANDVGNAVVEFPIVENYAYHESTNQMIKFLYKDFTYAKDLLLFDVPMDDAANDDSVVEVNFSMLESSDYSENTIHTVKFIYRDFFNSKDTQLLDVSLDDNANLISHSDQFVLGRDEGHDENRVWYDADLIQLDTVLSSDVPEINIAGDDLFIENSQLEINYLLTENVKTPKVDQIFELVLNVSINSIDILMTSLDGTDISSSDDFAALVVEGKDTFDALDQQFIRAYQLFFDSFNVEEKLVTHILSDAIFKLDFKVDTYILGTDIWYERAKAWNDADLIFADAIVGDAKIAVGVEADYVGLVEDVGEVEIYGKETGTIPLPSWLFEVNISVEYKSDDLSFLGVVADEEGILDSSSVLSHFSSDFFTVFDSISLFERDTFESGTFVYTAALDLISSEDVVIEEALQLGIQGTEYAVPLDIVLARYLDVFENVWGIQDAQLDIVLSDVDDLVIEQSVQEIVESEKYVSDILRLYIDADLLESDQNNLTVESGVIDVAVRADYRLVEEAVIEIDVEYTYPASFAWNIIEDKPDIYKEIYVFEFPEYIETSYMELFTEDLFIVYFDLVIDVAAIEIGTYAAKTILYSYFLRTDMVSSVDVASMENILWDAVHVIERPVIEVDVWGNIDSVESQRLTELIPVKEIVSVHDIAYLSIPVAERIIYTEDTILSFCIFDVGEVSDTEKITVKHLLKEQGIVKELGIVNVEAQDHAASLAQALVILAAWDTAYVEEIYDIKIISNIYAFTVTAEYTGSENSGIGLEGTEFARLSDRVEIDLVATVIIDYVESHTKEFSILAQYFGSEALEIGVDVGDTAVSVEEFRTSLFASDYAEMAEKHIKEFSILAQYFGSEALEIGVDVGDTAVSVEELRVSLFTSEIVDVIERYIKEFSVSANYLGEDFLSGIGVATVDEAVIIEEISVGLFASDYADVFERSAKEFFVWDLGEHCYNTIIYDPTITQRNLLYWWQDGYPGGFQDATDIVLNPKWGQDIQPGECGNPDLVPYVVQNFGTACKYTKTDYGPYPPSPFAVADTVQCLSFTMPGDRYFLFDPAADFRCQSTQYFLDKDWRFTTDNGFSCSLKFSFKNSDGSKTKIISVPVVSWTEFGGTYPDHFYSYPLTSKLIDFSEYVSEEFYSNDIDVAIIISYKFNLGSTTGTYAVSCGFALNYSELNPVYPTYRDKYISAFVDGWFLPIDAVVPENIQYKLYINMGCGPDENYNRDPIDDMEKFVYEKKKKYSHLDIIANYTGDIEPVYEEAVISLYSEDTLKYLDIVSDRQFVLQDDGFSCFNTVIYDPTITERELLYWWQSPYRGTGFQSELAPNDQWGLPIREGDADYPYKPGSEHFHEEIPYAYHADVSQSIYITYYDDNVYGPGDNKPYPGSWHATTTTPIDYYKEGWSTNVVELILTKTSGTFISFENLTFVGNTSMVFATTANVVKAVRIIHRYPDATQSDGYATQHYDISASQPAGSIDVIPDKSSVDCTEIFSVRPDSEFFVALLVYAEVYRGRWWSGNTYVLSGSLYGTGDIGPTDLYIKYRQQQKYIDGWFLPVDAVVPENIQYKLYLNMGCGPDENYNRDPIDDMEKFVYEKKKKYSHLDIIANFTGDIEPIHEDIIISVATDEETKYSDVVSYREFEFTDLGHVCQNTIIYDPSILQRDLLFWWQPEYPAVTGSYTLNPLWKAPIKPEDIDYPYYKNDANYGEIINFYGKLANTYASWYCNEGWYGESHTELVPQYAPGWDPNPSNPSMILQTYNWVEKTVVKSDTQVLFVSTDPLFKMETFEIDVAEKYLVTARYIPWDTLFTMSVVWYKYDSTVSGDYVKAGISVLPFSLQIIDQYWDGDNVRHTVYEFVPASADLVASDLFIGVEEKDYFGVELQCDFSWTGKFYADVYYEIDAQYYYFGQWAMSNARYRKYRAQYIAPTDEWFITKDVLYYEPLTFKLYMNMGCGAVESVDWVPVSPLERMIQHKMQKYDHLDIIEHFPGDHADIQDDVVIDLFADIIGHYEEDYDIVPIDPPFNIHRYEYGYLCEDVVVYSRSDLQDRDLMYWWEDGYPIVLNTGYIRSPLIGDVIQPGDFDYPYGKMDDLYGTYIYPERERLRDLSITGADAKDFSSYSPTIPDAIFVLDELTDNMVIELSGVLKVSKGTVTLKLMAVDSVTGHMYLIATLLTVEASVASTEIWKNPYTNRNYLYYTFAENTGEFVKFKGTYYVQDILNASGIAFTNGATNLCVVADIYNGCRVWEWHISAEWVPWADWGYDYSVELNYMIERYVREYTDVRAHGMHPTDMGFVTTDFYEDFFGEKLYVNLGCGPHVDSWPIYNDDAFERWVFRMARTGNYNRDYVFSGNYGYVEETPIIDLAETDHGTISTKWWFNNYEFTVTEIYDFTESANLSLLLIDDFTIMESLPTIELAMADSAKHSRVINQFVTMTLFEAGKIEIMPQYDLISSDIGEIWDSTIVSFEYVEAGKTTVIRDIQNTFTVYDSVKLAWSNLFEIPISDAYSEDAETVIDFKYFAHGQGEEDHKDYNLLYLNEKGLSDSLPILHGLYNYLSNVVDDALIIPVIKYVGKSREYVRPDRNEIYREVGYVCFWVQIVAYNYVIDWLVGHYVDYYTDMIQADFLRFTTCFGMPPGGWPQVEDYPDPKKIMPKHYPVPGHIDPAHPGEGYRDLHPPYYPTSPERSKGYIVIPVDSKLIYILNPTDPPEPYEWIGGTSLFLTKFITDETMQNAVQVVDAFYFALFDEYGNRVSEVVSMVLRNYSEPNGVIYSGTTYGALIFYDVLPNTRYFIKETDSKGNVYDTKFRSKHSGNTYLLPQNELECSTGDVGTCADAGNWTNILVETGTGGEALPGGGGGSYTPGDPGGGYVPGSGRSNGLDPIRKKGKGDPRGKGGGERFDPHTDGFYYPPYNPDSPPEIIPPMDIPGYEGHLHRVFDYGYLEKDLIINIPVDMMGFSWELHYIPAAYLLDLTGFKIEFLDDFDFEIEEPFSYSFDQFLMETDEPFRLDEVEILVEVESPFLFDEEYFEFELYEDPFAIDEIYFEFETLFEEFQFDQIEYTGVQEDPTPEVVPNVITYDGDEHALVQNRGQSGIIYYQIGNGPWVTEVPKMTNAGAYQVKWYAMASLLYTGYGSKTNYFVANAQINKAGPSFTIKAFEAVFKEYMLVEFLYIGDGQVSCESENPDLCTCDIISVVPEPGDSKVPVYRVKMRVYGVACGNNIIHILSDAGENYLPGKCDVPCAVVAGFIHYEVNPIEVDYTGTVVGSDISVYGPSEYKIYYSTEPITEESSDLKTYPDFYVDAGYYDIYFVIRAVNYEPVYGQYVLTINPAPQQITIIPAHPAYNTVLQPLIEDVYGVQGTIWFCVRRLQLLDEHRDT